MKYFNYKIIFGLLVGFFLVFPFASSAATLSLPPTNLGLVAYWPMNEGTGTLAHDFSGNGYNATFAYSAAWVAGKYGFAASVDTGNSSSQLQVSSVPTGAAWTTAWWSSFPLATFNGSWRTMFRSAVDDHQVIVDPSGNLGMYDNHFGAGFVSSGYNVNNLRGWHHITAVGSGSTTTFYIDGVSVGSSAVKSTSNIDYIGNYQYGGQNWGTIDDLRVYNRALSAAEITTLYKSGQVTRKVPTNLGLVGYWSMNEGNGTIAHDFSGNGNNGTIYNSPQWINGKRGSALQFNVSGSSQYIDLGNNPTISSLTNLTLSAWINVQAVGSYTDVISSLRDCCGAYKGYGLVLDGSNNPYLQIGDPSGGLWYLTDPHPQPVGKWVHLTATYDGSIVKFYVNGVLDYSVSYSGGIGTPATYNTAIGGLGMNPAAFSYHGSIDDVRIYNRALSATEIATLYNAGEVKINSSRNNVLTSGLVGLWSFDGADVSGTTATDRSGQGNDGTISGALPTIGKIGQAVSLSGAQYVDFTGNYSGYVQPSADTSASSMPSFSLSVWTKRTTDRNSVDVIFGKLGYNSGILEDDFGLWSSSPNTFPTVSYSVPLNTWYHAAMVYDNQTQIATCYINSVAVGTINMSGLTFQGNSSHLSASTNNGSWYYNGVVDDARIYNRSLSAAEIKQLYNAGK